MHHDDVFDPNRLGPAIAARLTSEPYLEPLARDAESEQRFSCFDLASWIDSRLGQSVDPDALSDPAALAHWSSRALAPGESLGRHFGFGRRPYWIVHDGRCIGTIAFSLRSNGAFHEVEISSLYVRSSQRRRGWASRALLGVRDAAFELENARVQLSCDWLNQSALRFYSAQGMWVQSWKRALRLYFAPNEPRWHMQRSAARVGFVIGERVLGTAEPHGRRLAWQLAEGVERNQRWSLEATAALQLALLGWPLIRSDAQWQAQIACGFSDCGDFEGLAFQIRQFERAARRRGWIVPPPNPSFAGLPTLLGVEARALDLDATLSDGRRFSVPAGALYPVPTADNPIERAEVDGDEVVVRMRSGEQDAVSVDAILWMHQSPLYFAGLCERWAKDGPG